MEKTQIYRLLVYSFLLTSQLITVILVILAIHSDFKQMIAIDSCLSSTFQIRAVRRIFYCQYVLRCRFYLTARLCFAFGKE